MNALRDVNYITTKLAVLNTDTTQGTNLVRLEINSSTGRIKMNATDSISFTMKAIDPRDDNYISCWLFEGTNGLTYPAVGNSSGELLVNSI